MTPEIDRQLPGEPRGRLSLLPPLNDRGRLVIALQRKFAAFLRWLDAWRAQHVNFEISSVRKPHPAPWIRCPHCRKIVPAGHRCNQRAIGFCCQCDRRRLLNGARCSNCGSNSITDIHFRWAVKRHA